jgi:predicted DNA binding CopG/RHH family protein
MLMDASETRKVNLFVESELWRLVKIRAAERGVTATAILNEALRRYFEAPAKQPRKGARA